MKIEQDTDCPPIGVWSFPEGSAVFCKSSGPDTEDGCDPNPCNANAQCVDLFDGYRCDCEYGYEANGKSYEENGDVCTLIPLVDECADRTLNNCHANATCTG